MDDLTREDELLVIRQGMDSPFWKLVSGKWGKFLEDATTALLNPKYDNRDFLAGKVRGMRDLLTYPDRRIETLLKLEKAAKDKQDQ